MQIEAMSIPDVKLITPKIFRDERGFFSETYKVGALKEAGIDDVFVQDNHAHSRAKYVVRGLHFQTNPVAQGKLIRVTSGAIFDVAVDIRHGSPTFGQNVSMVLSTENWCQLWVPAGFAHGYCTLEPDTEVIYKVTAPYAPECDRGIAWDDPALAIDWPVPPGEAILSDKDRKNLPLAEHPAYFTL